MIVTIVVRVPADIGCMGSIATDRVISELATHQYGIVTRAQLIEAGVASSAIHRRVDASALHRVHPGVYAVGHGALSQEGRRCAALLAAGPDAALSHLTAADAWRICRIRPVGVDITIPRSHRSLTGVKIHRTRQLPEFEVTTRDDGLRRTTVTRTIVDLAEELTPWQLTHVINEAAFRRRFRRESVERASARMVGRRGRSILLKAIAMHLAGSAGTKSTQEDDYLRCILAAGIAEPLVNVHVTFGSHQFELDFHWPELRVNVEVDGSGHLVPRRSKRDLVQDQVLGEHGWTVVRLTAGMVENGPEACVARTEAALQEVRGALRCSRIPGGT